MLMGESTLHNAATNLEASERYRSRARSMAGVVATGAGAIGAGLIFSNETSRFGPLAVIAGMVTFGLLLTGIVLFSWAALATKRPRANQSESDVQDALVESIWKRTRAASWVSIGALLFLFLTLLAVVAAPSPDTPIRVTLLVPQQALRDACPDIRGSFEATVGPGQLVAADELVSLTIRASDCDASVTGDSKITFALPRALVLLQAEST